MNTTRKTLVALAAALALAGLAFYAGRQTAPMDHAAGGADATAPAPAGNAAAGERKVLYWHDPMVPGPRFDKPGKSPFMDMQLVPVYADEGGGGSGVKVNAQVQQNLGIRTAAVTRAQVANSFEAVGAVQFDDRLTQAVQTRVAGYVERLLVRAPMEFVRRGQPLATVFAPDWLAPQNEYLALQRAGAAPELVAAARQRLHALSIPDALLRQSEAAGTAQARFTLVAPQDGVVAELGVREGVAVSPGTTLFRIAGLQKVWAVAEIPEAQAVRLVRGQKVKAALQADASQAFDGELKEILPQVSANTRTLQARFEVDNRTGRLVPGMLLRLQVAGAGSSRLVLPAEAVIRTGTRAVAIVQRPDGTFAPREVQLGADLGDSIEISSGLAEGDRVVVSGQFLIDSEARLKSVLGAMAAAPAAGAASGASGAAAGAAGASAAAPAMAATAAPAASAVLPPGVHVAEGTVESVEADSITIAHGPVPALQWPAMTMGFGKPDARAFADVKPGDRLAFRFRKGGPAGYELVAVTRQGAAK